jgi:hypothetical protein
MPESTDTGTKPLTCTYDVETNQMSFDWDAEAHPEYNFLLDITAEELLQMMARWAASDDAAAGGVND